MTADHVLHDLLRHGAGHDRQSIIHVPSTDPWHHAGDRDPATAQPSPIRMKPLGLIGPAPVTVPIGMLYDTPENMIAMLRHLQRFGVPVGQAELGEEPDGQFVTASDYGTLYVEYWYLSTRVHRRPNIGEISVSQLADDQPCPPPDGVADGGAQIPDRFNKSARS